MTYLGRYLPGLFALGALVVGCSFAGSANRADGSVGSGSGGSQGGGSGGTLITGNGGSSGAVGSGGSDGGIPISGFTFTEIGGYKLGEPLSTTSNPGGMMGPQGCNQVLGVVRDLKGSNEAGGHPDFETFSGAMPTTGMVATGLGADSKPVYTSVCEAGAAGNAACPYGQQTTSMAMFDQWYRSVDMVTQPFLIYFLFEPFNGVSTFQSNSFFPLDNAGWGNGNNNHNFGFTTELHTKFKYTGGENFTFIGDDDLWAFVNGKLAMDLGGLHPMATGTINLDAMAANLGITKGNVYALDLFHAERHTTLSNFRVDTNFVFVDCGIIVP